MRKNQHGQILKKDGVAKKQGQARGKVLAEKADPESLSNQHETISEFQLHNNSMSGTNPFGETMNDRTFGSVQVLQEDGETRSSLVPGGPGDIIDI